ncbi:esterase/lipase family protein [Ramlibacter algicola]|uniref:Alpha/beta hydrolase n=1 Tax=Ramlibacter algicola TaxID=2795217 RepID=A0A934PXT5_9BURK|nr:hypothetical protein [Ramlibacter algicola]MBK0391037.1 hypothetical protein [Ramlibacter algicola]
MQRPDTQRSMRPDPRSVRDLRGGVQLAFDAVRRSLDRIERVHERLADVSPPVRGLQPRPPTQGWASVVYRGLRGSADLLGGGADLALASVQAWAQDPDRGPLPKERARSRDAAIAALNAVLGDHLHRTGNPLAIHTSWRAGTPKLGRLLVLAHDLGLDPRAWSQDGAGFGDELATAIGATPLSLRYNAGRRVAAVAREVSTSLERQVAGWPVKVQGLDLVGHGLGGLVLRSALQQAQRGGLAWPALVRHVVFLGTPHAGARNAQWRDLVDAAGSGTHASLLLSRAANRRSEGMEDFTGGHWMEHEQGVPLAVLPRPWPAGARAYAIAGSLQERGDDGVVTVASALGRDLPPGQDLELGEAQRWIAAGVGHLELVRNGAVLQQVRHWLSV